MNPVTDYFPPRLPIPRLERLLLRELAPKTLEVRLDEREPALFDAVENAELERFEPELELCRGPPLAPYFLPDALVALLRAAE